MSMDIEKELTIAEGKKNYVIILRCISPEIQYNAPLVPTALRKTNSGGCRLIKGVVVLRLKANATYYLETLRNTTAFL